METLKGRGQVAGTTVEVYCTIHSLPLLSKSCRTAPNTATTPIEAGGTIRTLIHAPTTPRKAAAWANFAPLGLQEHAGNERERWGNEANDR